MDHSEVTPALAWRERPAFELLRLAWPMTVSMLSLSLMNAVDTLFVGHMGAAALSGVALANITTFTLFCFGLGLLRASKIAVAQAVGAGRRDADVAYLGASIWLGLGLGLATALLGQGVALGLPLLTTTAESGHAAHVYAALRLLGAPLVLLTAALRETRYGLGDSRAPMTAAVVSNLANAALVALFLHVFEWGVAGAAWATLIAEVVELGVLAWLQRAHGFGLRRVSAADVRVLARLGVPLGFERFFDVGSFSVTVALFARMGDVDLAAHQVATQALLLVFLLNNAIGETCSILVGQAVGAARLRIVLHVQRAALGLCYAVVAVVSCTLLCFGWQLAAMFTEDPQVIARAVELYRIGAVFVWFVPLYAIGQGSLRGIGDVRAGAIITVIAAWGCAPLFAATLGLGLDMGAPGGWLGIAAEFLLGGACFWWRLRGRGNAWLRQAKRIRSALRLQIAA
ncbi:MAG TPA: MATE family efflux transporter [Polyangiales bacterium]|nr:MATE family efflux transporter [Polyangiales bacterium]